MLFTYLAITQFAEFKFMCSTTKSPIVNIKYEAFAKHHTRQKLTKGHRMCADMADFPRSETNHGYLFVLFVI